MLPPKNDPRWKIFVDTPERFPVQCLATRMLMNRLKLKIKFDGSAASRQQGVDEAYEFFGKNESIVKDDIRLIFG